MPSNLMFNITKGDENLKISYECRGAHREMEYGIFVLTRGNEKDLSRKKEYFLCIDNRPLVNLKDADMTLDELQTEQKAFFDEFCSLMESYSNGQFWERYELLQFTGNLSSALDEYSQNKTKMTNGNIASELVKPQ